MRMIAKAFRQMAEDEGMDLFTLLNSGKTLTLNSNGLWYELRRIPSPEWANKE